MLANDIVRHRALAALLFMLLCAGLLGPVQASTQKAPQPKNAPPQQRALH